MKCSGTSLIFWLFLFVIIDKSAEFFAYSLKNLEKISHSQHKMPNPQSFHFDASKSKISKLHPSNYYQDFILKKSEKLIKSFSKDYKLQKRFFSPINRIVFSFFGPKLLRTVLSELVRKLTSVMINMFLDKFSKIDHLATSSEVQPLFSYGSSYKKTPEHIHHSTSPNLSNDQLQLVFKYLPVQEASKISGPMSYSYPLYLSSSSSSSMSNSLNNFINQQIMQQFEQKLRHQLFLQLQNELLPNLPSHLNQQAQEEMIKMLPKLYKTFREEINSKLELPKMNNLHQNLEDNLNIFKPTSSSKKTLPSKLKSTFDSSKPMDYSLIAKIIKSEFETFEKPDYSKSYNSDLLKKPKSFSSKPTSTDELRKKIIQQTLKYSNNNDYEDSNEEDDQKQTNSESINTNTLISYNNIRDIIDQDDKKSDFDEQDQKMLENHQIKTKDDITERTKRWNVILQNLNKYGTKVN